MCEVSVLCTTFNQEPYLRDALDSIISQNTEFEYEIIIHDDASTDGTTSIIREYVAKFPNLLKVIYETDNQYSKGYDFIEPIVKNIAKGKYVAVCEGDDYWIDSNKLQIQYDALESHPECDMCACWGCTVTEDGNREVSQIRPLNYDGILEPEQVILGGGQYLVTAGLFFRKSMYDNMLGLDSLDYSWQMRGAIRGGIYYIDKKMAAYRRYAKGSWTNEVLCNDDKLKLQWEKERGLLRILDKNTDGLYHSVIEERLKAYTSFDEQIDKRKSDILDLINECERPRFLWGIGRRGKSLENFFKNEGIAIDGVCDAINENIGLKDERGNTIFHTDYVTENAATILTSTQWAYNDLIKMELKGRLVGLQMFMPYG